MLSNILAENPPIRVKQCRHGLFMYNLNDTVIGQSLDNYGEFSEFGVELLQQIIKPGMTVLDIGANIGVHTVPMAKAIGASGQVIAIEPQRIINQMLSGNVAMNGLTNVMVLTVALGKDMGMMTVPLTNYGEKDNFGSVSMALEGDGESVPLLTVDSFNLPRCDFIKVNVEGMEGDVLEGAAKTLTRSKPIIYFDNDGRDEPLKLINFLFEKDYRLYSHQPPLFNKNNFYENKTNIFENQSSNNVLGIPKDNPPSEMKNFIEITPSNVEQFI